MYIYGNGTLGTLGHSETREGCAARSRQGSAHASANIIKLQSRTVRALTFPSTITHPSCFFFFFTSLLLLSSSSSSSSSSFS